MQKRSLDFIIYEEALNKIKKAGFDKRLEKKKDKIKDHYHIGSYVSSFEIPDYVNELKKSGFFKTMPKEEKENFQETIQKCFNKSKENKWALTINGKKEEFEVNELHILTLLGWYSSLLLNKKEIWNYKNFGFSSLSEFAGTLGAYIHHELTDDMIMDRGEAWESSHSNGRKLINVVSGDINADLRIIQTDITQYETIDPFKNKVFYRPILKDLNGIVVGYHSTEARLLVSLLKYAHYLEKEKELKEKIPEMLKEIGKQDEGAFESTAKHLGGYDKNPIFLFIEFDRPLLKLNDDLTLNGEFGSDFITTSSQGHYNLVLGKDKELLIGFLDEKKKFKTCGNFVPEDVNPFISSLLYQCKNFLGRTSIQQQVAILNYRFSDQFNKDQKELKK